MVSLDLLHWVLSVIVAVASVKMWIKLEGMERSTHRIQYVDPTQAPGLFGAQDQDDDDPADAQALDGDPFDDLDFQDFEDAKQAN